MKKNKLVKSGILFTIGNLLIQGVAFITLPIYTRTISQEVFGQYTLYFAWVSLFSIMIGLQTSGSFGAARVKFPEEYKEYAMSSLTVSTITFLFVLLASTIFRNQLSPLFGLTPTIFIVMIIQSFTTYLTLFFGNYFIQQQKSGTNLIITISSTILNVMLSLFLIFYWEDDYLARIVGGIVPTVLTAIITMIYFNRLKVCLYHKKYLSFMLKVSIPLIFHQLGYQLLNQQSRIMIGNMLSSRDVAIYSFGFSMGLIIQIVLNSMNMAWVPWYFDAKRDGYDYQSTLNVLVVLATFLTLGYLTIFPELGYILGGEKYIDSITFVHLIVIGYYIVFLSSIPINVQFFNGNTKLIPVGTLITALLNFGLNYYLIPIFGVKGGAISSLISYGVLLLLHHFITKLKYNYTEANLFMYMKWIVIVIFYSFLINLVIGNIFIRWGMGLFMCLVFVFLYWNPIIEFFKNVRRKR